MGLLRSRKEGSSSSSSSSRGAAATSPCAQLRAAYNDCFNKWYSEKFSKGKWDKQECVSEWNNYRACLTQCLEDKHLSRFLQVEAVIYPTEGDEQAH